jgi:type VII secretion protein EccB
VSSRQDQLHSYQYSLQRVVAALVTHDPDPSRSPFRRVGSTALVSVLIAILALGGTAAYAAVTNRGATSATAEGTIYIEKETGARFVFYKPDNRLHPVLNYTSGRLIIGSANATSERVPRKTLAKVARGDLMGIPGAPDALPARRDLTAGPWAVCTQQANGAAQSLLVVGDPIAGGTAATAGALLVQDPTDRTFLVYGNRRFLIPDFQPLQAAFIWSDRQPVQVAAAWINALPAGPDLAPLPVPERGRLPRVDILPGIRNGELIQARDGDGPSQWAVALPDGAAVVGETQARLQRTIPGSGQPRRISTAEFGILHMSEAGQGFVNRALAGHPPTVPELLTATQRLCLSVSPKDGATTVLVDPDVPAEGNPAPAAGGVRRIDRVLVPAGAGVVVEAAASPTAPAGSGTISIVTDAGLRYPVVDAATLGMLGFDGITPQRLPAELVALLPEGPALDPKQAVKSPPIGG